MLLADRGGQPDASNDAEYVLGDIGAAWPVTQVFRECFLVSVRPLAARSDHDVGHPDLADVRLRQRFGGTDRWPMQQR